MRPPRPHTDGRRTGQHQRLGGRSRGDGPIRLNEVSDEELAALSRAGDSCAIETLLVRYRGYVRAKAGSYFLPGADRDDVFQEGMIGLFKAVRDFQQDRQSSFRAFAELCVSRQIVSAVRAATCQKHSVLNDYVPLDRLTTGEQPPAHAKTSALKDFYITLSMFESKVLTLYAEGRSYQEIANRLGRSMKSVDNALQRIKRKIELAHLQSSAVPG